MLRLRRAEFFGFTDPVTELLPLENDDAVAMEMPSLVPHSKSGVKSLVAKESELAQTVSAGKFATSCCGIQVFIVLETSYYYYYYYLFLVFSLLSFCCSRQQNRTQ